MCAIDKDSDNETWSSIVSCLNPDALFRIFLQQPFADYSQEALKLLNNLIVDIPELAAQVPNDFVAIISHTPKIVKISLSRTGNPIKKQKAIIA
jgi:hypothetical protein